MIFSEIGMGLLDIYLFEQRVRASAGSLLSYDTVKWASCSVKMGQYKERTPQ